MEPIERDLDCAEIRFAAEPMLLNVGPSHPATHGTVRIVVELSGETTRYLGPGLPVRRSLQLRLADAK